MKKTLLESVIIGTLAGGWACSSYWTHFEGVVVGLTAGLMAFYFLAGDRYGRKNKHMDK